MMVRMELGAKGRRSLVGMSTSYCTTFAQTAVDLPGDAVAGLGSRVKVSLTWNRPGQWVPLPAMMAVSSIRPLHCASPACHRLRVAVAHACSDPCFVGNGAVLDPSHVVSTNPVPAAWPFAAASFHASRA